MKRASESSILADLPKKIVLLTGPRQCGKTWLSRNLGLDAQYLNYDNGEHRQILKEKAWDRRAPLVVFDELHKMPDWKQFLKGIYDVEGLPPSLLVTGSARLDLMRQVGDSLAGRYFQHRLHPFDVRELAGQMDPQEVLERVMRVGGFPEPFLENDGNFYGRWKTTHLDIILRQDLLDLVTVSDLHALTLLVDLLRRRVGSPISHASLAQDLQKDPKTIKRWLEILEDLYVVFAVRPFHQNVARAMLKEPKYYFFDVGQVADEAGVRLENAVACSVFKQLQALEDLDGRPRRLAYIRTKDGREIDFAVVEAESVTHLVEVKLSEENLSPSFKHLGPLFPQAAKVQLVLNPKRERTWPTGEELRPAAQWLVSW